MKCGVRVALGVAGGYLLGRTKKMKLAMMLGGMAAGRQAGGPGQLLGQGMKLLGQSPELSRLTDELGGRLLDAGKAAAVAIATRQVENLTERVVGQIGALTDAGGKAAGDVASTVGDAGGTVGKTVGGVGGTVEKTVGRVGKTVGGLGRQRSREDVEDVEDVEGPGEKGGGEPTDLDEAGGDGGGDAPPETDEDEGPPSRRAARAGAGGNGAGDAAPKRAGGRARLAGKAAAATRRSARPRTAGAQ